MTYTTLLSVRTALAPDILHQHGICRHAGVDGKRKQLGLASKKRYERAAGARVLDRVHTQWVPVSAPGVQERCRQKQNPYIGNEIAPDLATANE